MEFILALIQWRHAIAWFCVLLTFVQNGARTISASNYLVGLGSYNITWHAADVNMMGYANLDQIASGVHFRLHARAFIVVEPQGSCVVFVNLDACMASQLATIKVLERLKARGKNFEEQMASVGLGESSKQDSCIIHYNNG